MSPKKIHPAVKLGSGGGGGAAGGLVSVIPIADIADASSDASPSAAAATHSAWKAIIETTMPAAFFESRSRML